MENLIKRVLEIQHSAWKNGHDNCGASIDVLSSTLYFLKYFKHLNLAQKKLLEELNSFDNLIFAKKLCSRANKTIRHYVVSLK